MCSIQGPGAYLSADLLLAQTLKLARETVSSVVADDIDATELVKRRLEGSLDGVVLGDIEIDGEVVLVGGSLWLLELGGVTCSSDNVVTLLDGLLDVLGAEAGGCTSNEENAWCHVG